MNNPNKDFHIEWIGNSTREDAVYDYPKLSLEESETLEEWCQEILSVYNEGNEAIDVAELICMMISIFASRSPQEQQGILISALRKSAEIHEEMFKEEKLKLEAIKKLFNKSKN